VKILFATSNRNKLLEISAALPESFSIYSLSDVSDQINDVEEPFETLDENAMHKASSYATMTGMNCFSEDTGLEVTALENEPGVRSARYAGEPSDPQKNITLLLAKLADKENRSAQFRTVIALTLNHQLFCFEGICKGVIIKEQKGSNGFGYDPIFIPEGSTKTFAEMTTEEKNKFSHRKKALFKMIEFLKTQS
jgi:XTP/dITP diphosphohydrolase